ncbi:MAG: hypothetical protein ACRBF0_15520 [Calditrichia bacterium]
MGPLKNITSAAGEVQKRENTKGGGIRRERLNSSDNSGNKGSSKGDKAVISDSAREMLDLRNRAFKLFDALEQSGDAASPHQLDAIRTNILEQVYQGDDHLDKLADMIGQFLGGESVDGNDTER